MCSSSASAQKLNKSCDHGTLVGFSWVVVHYAWQQHEDADLQQQRKSTEAEQVLRPRHACWIQLGCGALCMAAA